MSYYYNPWYSSHPQYQPIPYYGVPTPYSGITPYDDPINGNGSTSSCPNGQCSYGTGCYSPGSVICQFGKQYYCSSGGNWFYNGASC
ncbi:hypothetical protein KQ3_04914 [Bacillus cereus B5-2]|nr:hypothetical protein KQ3_04914 [Bacillus cereus B5-2]